MFDPQGLDDEDTNDDDNLRNEPGVPEKSESVDNQVVGADLTGGTSETNEMPGSESGLPQGSKVSNSARDEKEKQVVVALYDGSDKGREQGVMGGRDFKVLAEKIAGEGATTVDVKSLEDAINKLKEMGYTKESIDQLLLVDHSEIGGPQHLGNDKIKSTGRLVDSDANNSKELASFVKKSGEVVCAGCEAGGGKRKAHGSTEGERYLQDMANWTKRSFSGFETRPQTITIGGGPIIAVRPARGKITKNPQ